MEMKNNDDKIIWIDNRTIQVKGIEGVTVSFAKEEDPTLVDRILGMVIRGAATK